MFRSAKVSQVCASSAAAWMQRRAASLQSEKPCATLADKIVRGEMTKTYYTHPSYVMSRDKMLHTIWVDIGVFNTCAYVMFPFFMVAYFFKA